VTELHLKAAGYGQSRPPPRSRVRLDVGSGEIIRANA
jgi:hypothetical protein